VINCIIELTPNNFSKKFAICGNNASSIAPTKNRIKNNSTNKCILLLLFRNDNTYTRDITLRTIIIKI
jgi:hypothetical protein